MYNQVHFLRKKGVDVKVVHLAFKSPSSTHPYVSQSIPTNSDLLRKLSVLQNEFQPDIIHFDSPWPAGKIINQVFNNVPRFISIGGRTFDEFKDYHKYTQSPFLIGKVKGIFLSTYSRHVLNHVTGIFAEGTDIEKHLREHRVNSPVFSINNGIDYSRFSYKPRKGKTALFFGRFSWENGPDTFIEIMKELPEFKAKMVGYGPLEDQLKIQAEKVNNIEILGPVDWKEIPKLLNQVDYILLPFRRIGGISQTVTESMAAGKVVLTRAVGDLHKPILNGKTGFFFDNYDEAREILNKLDTNLKLRRSIERSARKKIIDDFSWEKIIEKYLKLYNL